MGVSMHTFDKKTKNEIRRRENHFDLFLTADRNLWFQPLAEVWEKLALTPKKTRMMA